MKVKDLKVEDLRTRYFDSIADLIKELLTIETEADATAYYNAQNISRQDCEDRKILGFEEAGNITRYLVPLIGKSSTHLQKVIQYDRRWAVNTGWKAREVKRATFVTWKGLPLQKAIEISNTLAAKGIEFGMTSKGVLELFFPENTPPSCFYTSDLPEVWEKKRVQKIKASQINAVTKKLDRR